MNYHSAAVEKYLKDASDTREAIESVAATQEHVQCSYH